MSRHPDPHTKLGQWLSSRLAPAQVTLKGATLTPWMSATFAGARHHYDFTVHGDEAAEAVRRFEAVIRDDEVALDGHIVADMIMTYAHGGSEHVYAVGVDALTVGVV